MQKNGVWTGLSFGCRVGRGSCFEEKFRLDLKFVNYSIMLRKFSASSRLIHELFTQYQSTFLAFRELINNSIQADSENIKIEISYSSELEFTSLPIKRIVITDDGHGVHINELDKKILGIGDSEKKGGKGIGRFAAIQIGAQVTIETVGYDNETGSYSYAKIPFTDETFKKIQRINELEVDTTESILEGKQKTYYKVTIENLYDTTITSKFQKRRVSEKLLERNIETSLFETYPIPVFTQGVKFFINDAYLNPQKFVLREPEKIKSTFNDRKGKEHDVLFTFFNLKPNFDRIKVFLTTKNAGVDSIIGGFEYQALWLSPKIGSWFVYISSDLFQTDIYRNLDIDTMDDVAALFKIFIKDKLNYFFKSKNKEYDDFAQKLKSDNFYPYKQKENITSETKVALFDKLAYLVEEKYNLLNEKNKLREIVYPLIDRTITSGELDGILRNILRLENKYIKKFNELLNKSNLEDVIEFSEKVAHKIQSLELLEKITLSELSKHVLERKELHKLIEKMLWIFGEHYSENTNLLSDKNLENNLTKLRNEFLEYKRSKHDDNHENLEAKLKSITDLFLYSEKIVDEEKREILIVELKAPKVKISPKELEQVMGYANQIEKKDFYTEKLKFHIILISSNINQEANFRLKGAQKGKNDPHFYFENEVGNIRVSVMKWSDLIESNKRKFKYMASKLKTKDVSVQEILERDFSEIDFQNLKSKLTKVTIPE
jgi:hypothetical protein